MAWPPVTTSPFRGATPAPTCVTPGTRLQTALTSAAGRTALAEHHLRPGDRTPIPAEAGGRASLPDPPGEPMPVIAEHYLYHVLTTFHPSRRKANILVVIDVSGSMRDRAPHSSSSLITLVRSGVTQLTDLMPATSHVGLWEFGSHLDGDKDYRSLVATRKLSTAQRDVVDAAAHHLDARATGTGIRICAPTTRFGRFWSPASADQKTIRSRTTSLASHRPSSGAATGRWPSRKRRVKKSFQLVKPQCGSSGSYWYCSMPTACFAASERQPSGESFST